MKKVVLKPEKEKSVHRRHPWIFSGAIASIPEITPGEILPIYSSSGTFLAQGSFHPTNSLAGRIISFDQRPVSETLLQKLVKALDLRKQLFNPSQTNAYRLVNSEGDGIPGLVVDVYDTVLVLQVNTCGMELLKPFFVDALIKLMQPSAIYEKSTSASRRSEGLEDREEWLWGTPAPEVEILENGIKFRCAIEQGQKTGFFFDQREMRKLILGYAKGKKVLNCFSYTGGFSLYALKGGAAQVTSIDASESANQLAAVNTQLNGFASKDHTLIKGDVFALLKEKSRDYDFIILDPPAFAKKRSDVDKACQGYKEINRTALEKMPPKSLLLTCSCSHFIDDTLFQNLIFQASLEAKREVKIIGRHLLAPDHPILIYHPEGGYLKSLLLYAD
jgi:23S rRNA (cytosine1962-C5)-methyltransferase